MPYTTLDVPVSTRRRAAAGAGSLEQVIAMEDRNQVLCTQTNDFREGVTAFLQKRTPRYTES